MEKKVNNFFYDELNEKWHEACDHPVALLRAENVLRTPWIIKTLLKRYGEKCTVLDIGCGGGLLANPLASTGFQVTGIDLSAPSLEAARKRDETKSVNYLYASAEALPFENGHFDVAFALDLLEHVENPYAVIQEAARVIKPGGLFFFHTFNRNLLSHLVVIKGVEWFVANAPKNMHIYRLFITLEEIRKYCEDSGLKIEQMMGIGPNFKRLAFWKMLCTRKVPEDFAFEFKGSLKCGYIGYSIKAI